MTPADCDLRDFVFMPLDVVRLRDSDLAALEDPAACWGAVLLWCASWHQLPAASLPHDDRILAQLAGFGRVVKEWMKIRGGALRGWVLCSDERLYHPVVAEKAIEAWQGKLEQRWKTECARIKKHNQRYQTNIPFPTFEEFLSSGKTKLVPRDKSIESPETGDERPGDVPSETPSKGQGEGQGKDKEEPPIPPDGGLPEPVQAKGRKRNAVGFQRFLEDCDATGEMPIPEDDPVFAYAVETGIPIEFLRLHWLEFKERYTAPDAKRYKDWRSVYRKSVRGCWFKLWFLRADGACGLTTQGEQAKRHHGRDLS